MQKTLAELIASIADDNGCIPYDLAFNLASLQGESVAIDFVEVYGIAASWSMGVDLGEFLVWVNQSAEGHYGSLWSLKKFKTISSTVIHSMPAQTKLKNQSIIETIGQQLVDDLYSLVKYSHESLTLELHEYHENCINERENARTSEKLKFKELFNLIVNSELQDIYESLQDYSQKAVRNYVRDVYPDWRDSMV